MLDSLHYILVKTPLIGDAYVYARNRWVSKIHMLKSDLPKGRYFDLDHRILHTLFTELCDFIEGEQASCFKDADEMAKYTWVDGKSREAGLDHIEWAMSLKHDEDSGIQPNDPDYGKPTGQALAAAEQKALYLWWKDERPNRLDPYAIKPVPANAFDIEARQYDEDTEMLCRLMRIRGSLLT